ncbi:MAG: peptide deformylase [Deltaproteobacteria bacterium]|nr:peptide deformylase [Deltaproteobacteria bacterium]
MHTLKIVQVGNPTLRARARAVTLEELATPKLQDLIALMRDTMREAPGVGLAAPQIDESLQIAVIEDAAPQRAGLQLTPEQLAERERRDVPYHVIVNPTLSFVSSTGAEVPAHDEESGAAPHAIDAVDDYIEAYEGCLSFSGFIMVVPRAHRVRVSALDERGAPVQIDATGWYARILQHEIDHLHGIVCCDRMDARTLSTQDNHARRGRPRK